MPLIFVVWEKLNEAENKIMISNHDLVKVVNREGLHKKQFTGFIGFDFSCSLK